MALRDITLNISHGEFVCIVGDVGSGKSSMLNAIIGDMMYLDREYIDRHQDLNVNVKENA